MAVENIPEITARDFGIRIAKAFKSVASSNVFYFMQQAYKDVGGLEELEWEDVVVLFDRIINEPDTKTASIVREETSREFINAIEKCFYDVCPIKDCEFYSKCNHLLDSRQCKWWGQVKAPFLPSPEKTKEKE